MKHMAKYAYPGILFDETGSVELEKRSVEEATAKAAKTAIAFTLYDLADPGEVEHDESLFKVTPKPQNESGRHYLGGEIFTLDEVESAYGTDPSYAILISNMRANDIARVIRTRLGNWQPFNDDAVLLDEPEHLIEARQKAGEARREQQANYPEPD